MGAAAHYFSDLMPPDAKALARGLRRRDPDLLDSLIQQYQYRLYRYLVSLTGAPETAEDLFQETWIRVLDRGHQYDGESKFETWLFAIARHLVIDLSRKKTLESFDLLGDEPAAGGASAWECAVRRETESQVQASVEQLPASYREVLLLRFQEDLTLEEIAAVLGTALSTVKSRLYRGLEALRLQMGGNRP
jgi:RNA polymerase sigma-70 factor (ECF subfamily)